MKHDPLTQYISLRDALVREKAELEQRLREISQALGSDQGSVGSHSCHAINIVPYPAFPAGAAQRIGHRLTVRQQMFYDRLSRSADSNH